LPRFGFTSINRQFFYGKTKSVSKPWLVAALLYPIAILMSWPYVMALNAATAKRDIIIYSGPIERKWVQHSARFGDTCMIDMRDKTSSQIVTITVSLEYYASVSEGLGYG
jgi:hypothetical protein